MEKLQVNINILQSQVDESEAKYDILEAMLQKPEKTWTEEERIQFVNKKSLREAEEKLQDILTSARQKLIDMHSEKLKLLQRASAAQVSKNVGRKAAPKGINTSPTGRTQGATRPAGDSDSFQSPSEPLNGYRDRERE